MVTASGGGWNDDPYDLQEYFLHDVDPAVAAEGEDHQRSEAEIVFGQTCDIEEWPAVPTRAISGSDDRFFPLALQQRVAQDRLGIAVEVVPGGHLAALAQPDAVAAAILRSA